MGRDMSIRNVLAGVAAKNLEVSVAWYTRLLGRGPDARPMAGLAEWEFEGGGFLQLFTDLARAGSSSVTFVEDDLEARRGRLGEEGVPIVSEADNEFVKTTIVRDPDGNQVVLAEAVSRANRAAST